MKGSVQAPLILLHSTLLYFSAILFACFFKLKARPFPSKQVDLLYYGGLKPNLQYLLGVPVHVAISCLVC